MPTVKLPARSIAKIRDPVAIGIALQRRDAERAVVEIIQLSSEAVESRGADEPELVIAAGAGDGVDGR